MVSIRVFVGHVYRSRGKNGSADYMVGLRSRVSALDYFVDHMPKQLHSLTVEERIESSKLRRI